MTAHIDISEFKKRSDFRSLLTVSAHAALVLAPVYIAAFIGPGLYWIALWLSFGILMNGLLNLMHESAHRHVFVHRGGSDFLGRWILGPLALTDFDEYRRRHWKHHTNLGIDGDTKDAYLVPIQGLKLVWFALRCMTLQEALRKFNHQTLEDAPTGQRRSNSMLWLARTILVQTLFLASLMLVALKATHRQWPRDILFAATAYCCVYLYGLASLTVFVATLRAIAEHQLETGQQSSTGRAALRNFSCGPIARLILGAYGFAEHATHHHEPALPYYHLREATDVLAAGDRELAPEYHYWKELVALAAPPRETGVYDHVHRP
jgi:fatty acid desaturase